MHLYSINSSISVLHDLIKYQKVPLVAKQSKETQEDEEKIGGPVLTCLVHLSLVTRMR